MKKSVKNMEEENGEVDVRRWQITNDDKIRRKNLNQKRKKGFQKFNSNRQATCKIEWCLVLVGKMGLTKSRKKIIQTDWKKAEKCNGTDLLIAKIRNRRARNDKAKTGLDKRNKARKSRRNMADTREGGRE